MQRSAVNQRNLQCLGYPVSRSRESNHILHCRDYKKQNNNEVSNISYFVIKKKYVCKVRAQPDAQLSD